MFPTLFTVLIPVKKVGVYLQTGWSIIETSDSVATRLNQNPLNGLWQSSAASVLRIFKPYFPDFLVDPPSSAKAVGEPYGKLKS